MSKRALCTAILTAALLIATDEARAQEEGADGVRFRGGIRAQGGVMLIPDAGVNLTEAGVQGHVGAQINDLVGVYWAPSIDVFFGEVGGPFLGSAVVVDFTFADRFQIGGGPDVGAFVIVGDGGAAAALYGGRLHLAAFPLVGDGDDGIRRKGLAVGADLRVNVAEIAVASSSGAGTGSLLLLTPTAFIGYEAF